MPAITENSSWLLHSVAVEQEGRTSRVSIELNGLAIWFESDDVVLEPAIEAFAGALLLPSLYHGVDLRIETPVDAEWLAQIQHLYQIYREWWGFNQEFPIKATTQTPLQSRLSATGLYFTGGVNSFFSLLNYPKPINRLVFAHGYHIPLDDIPRLETCRRSLNIIAETTGQSAIILRTNLREHPFIQAVPWHKTYGSSLAALGLILSGEVGKFVVPPSYASTELQPWGSHPQTDPLFSTARCQILHHSTPLNRRERIHAIAPHPLTQQHLRVCYTNITLTKNCSTCETCVRTMVALAGTGYLPQYTTFNHSKSLAARIIGLGAIRPHLIPLWQEALIIEKNPILRRAIQVLVHHSKTPSWTTHLRTAVHYLSFKLQRLVYKIQRFYLRWRSP